MTVIAILVTTYGLICTALGWTIARAKDKDINRRGGLIELNRKTARTRS